MRSPPGLVHTVDIPDYRKAAKLPADVEQNLSLFTGMLADNLHADKNMPKKLLDGVEAYTKNYKIVYSHLMLNVIMWECPSVKGKRDFVAT